MTKKKIGILYATVDGQTLKICTEIERQLKEKGYNPDLTEINSFDKEISDYDIMVIGASIRYGVHAKTIEEFMKQNREKLQDIRTAFFSVNLVARKEEKNRHDTNPYVIKYLKRLGWTPEIVDVFAGRLDYDAYGFFDRLMIKLIMKMTKGPTKTEKPIEYTDWDRVAAFAEKVIA